MSHIVTIKSVINDASSVSAACRRLRMAEPYHGTATLFSGDVSGFVVQFPGWQYPAVINLASGEIKYDNFQGQWGDEKEIGLFFQFYAVERAKMEARKKGFAIHEESLQDGSIKLQILEAV